MKYLFLLFGAVLAAAKAEFIPEENHKQAVLAWGGKVKDTALRVQGLWVCRHKTARSELPQSPGIASGF